MFPPHSSPSYHLQPTPERALVIPVAKYVQEKSHNTIGWNELDSGRARKFVQTKPLANFVLPVLAFFLSVHKPASSESKGAIGSGHFIYQFSVAS